MKKILGDPLLTLARVGTIVVQIALLIGQIALGIALAATVMAAYGWLPDDAQIEFNNEIGTSLGFAGVAIFGAMVALGLMTFFVVRLRQIIDTVGAGDPFVAENATRLTQMGWLALGSQLISVAITLFESTIRANVPQDSFEIHSEASLTGFGLAIVLFILARVFRKGAQMRAELEGTV
jgi:hypothetical protein